jgi:ankyrin repeat protein
VEKLLAFGADVNASGCRTVLQVAAQGGHKEIVEKLLAFGADINAAAAFAYDSRTALEIVEKLLAVGADVNAAAAFGYKHRGAIKRL